MHAIWWPVFDISAAPEIGAVRDALARLHEYQLAIFVSAHAVSATRSMLATEWPVGTMLGAVGNSTREAIDAQIRPPAGSIVISPQERQESGSETFWDAWQRSGHRARRVLLLRAEQGRSWLIERFAESGARVDAVAAYTRRPHPLAVEDRVRLQQWIAGASKAAIVFSSTEAIAALDVQVGPNARSWLRAGTAVACHPRIAQHLKANGYTRVLDATYDDDSIIAKLESIRAS